MKISENERQELINLIYNYGMIDGAHHKQWLIDQTLRYLLGKNYNEAIAARNNNPDNRDWDTGIAP